VERRRTVPPWSDIPNDVQLRRLDEDGHAAPSANPAGNSQRQHLRIPGRPARVRTRQPSGCPLRATRRHHRPRRQVARASRFNAPTTSSSIRRRDLVSPTGLRQSHDYEATRASCSLKRPFTASTSRAKSKVLDDMSSPMGLCFSPDYKKLYVCDTGASHYEKARRTSVSTT